MSLEPAASSSKQTPSPAIPTLAVILLLGGLAILPTAGCLTAKPSALDESVLVFENPLVRGDVPWWNVFTTRHYYQYTPVTFLANRLNADLFGLDAVWSFRLINWLIHAASACVLWRLLGRLGLSRRACLFVACAWAAHPMACESVAWIAERSNALAFLFGAIALWSYVRWYGRWPGLLCSSIAFAAALLSKPLALGWLPIFFVLEALGGPARLQDGETSDVASTSTGTRSARNLLLPALRLLPLVVLAVVFLLVGLSSYETADRPPPGGSSFTALLTDTGLFLRYVWNTLVPVGLSAMYAVRDIVSLTDGRLWLNVLVWAGLLGGSVFLAGSRRRAIFGWLWFFGALGPACNVVAIGYPMQDRYAYLASAGLLIVCVEMLAGVSQRCAASQPWIRHPFAGALAGGFYIAFLAILTLLRSPLWGNNLELMRQAVERDPDGALPHFFYAKELEWQARELEWNATLYPPEARALRQAAAEHFAEGLQKPDAYVHDPFPSAIMLARNWALSGQPEEAIALLEKSMPDPRKCQIISKYGLRYIRVPEDRFGFPYSIPLLTLAEGHYWLGEAHLALAFKAPPDQTIRLLDRVSTEARSALAINPACYEAYALLAKEFLFREALQESGPRDGLAVARGRLMVAVPQLDRMGRDLAVLRTITLPLPPARIPALACLAMARAAFEAARAPTETDSTEQIQDALAWAQRASKQDPAFGEGFWLQAEIYTYILDHLPEAKSADAVSLREKRRSALEAIGPASPRYGLARKRL